MMHYDSAAATNNIYKQQQIDHNGARIVAKVLPRPDYNGME